MTTAFITGVTGQDGSYLAELLLSKGYTVYGLVRRSANPHPWRLAGFIDQIKLIDGDMTDTGSLFKALAESKPDEVYNLAAQSYVPTSFLNEELTMNANALGVFRLINAMRTVCPKARLVQASSSEMFGKVRETPQSETTPHHPRSPYGISKVAAYWGVVNARESGSLFACNAISFNHESPRRGEEFVTRKITLAAARIALGKQEELSMGNLNAMRDWGYAPEYVEAMWRMLQRDTPDDYVLATGETHTVSEFIKAAFEAAGVNDIESRVKTSTEHYRPTEVELLVGDPRKAGRLLLWTAKTKFKQLAEMMVEADLERLR